MNTATQIGLAAVNKSRQHDVELKAQQLILSINGRQSLIKENDKAIASEQEQLTKLALDVISQESIMGHTMTGDLNPNQVTIANAIKKLNEDRQKSVELKSQVHINRIDGLRKTTERLNKEIEEDRAALAKLEADVITPEAVVGNK